MEHELTVITLALNYSALTSQHLHSRHLRESKGVHFPSAPYVDSKMG